MLALLWLLLIRPARRRQVAQRELHAAVEVGDEIVTAGGVFGHVVEAHDEDELLVEVAPNVNLRIARRAVAAVVPPEEEGVMESSQDDEEGSPGANPNDMNRG